MRRLVSLFSIFFLVVGIASLTVLAPAAAQQTDVNAVLKRAQELYAAGNYPAALIEAQKLEAAVKAQFGTNHVNYALALSTLADVYQAQDRYAEAEAHYKRALAIREARLGKDHTDVADTLNDLANAYQAQGKYAEAEAHYQRALAISEAKLGKDHLDVAGILNNLAVVSGAQGRHAQAEAHYKRALAIRETKLGKDHPNVAATLNNLAGTYEELGKYAEAEAHYKRALAIKEAKLGKDDPSVALTLTSLGLVYEEQGKYVEAEDHHKRALAIFEAKLGRDHVNVAATLNNLAGIYRVQGKYAEAEAHSKRALAILEAKLGKDHPDAARPLNGLANIYNEQGRYVEAEAHYRRALAIQEATLGKDHASMADTLNNLAVVYQAQRKYAEAAAHYRRALAIYEAKLGKDHPAVAAFLLGLANVYQVQGKYADAEAHYKRALEIAEKKGKDHPDVARILNNLAGVYELQGNAAQAETHFKRALAIREVKLGKDHPAVANTLNNLARAYRAQGKVAEALASVRKASTAIISHAATEAAEARHKSGAQGLVEQRSDFFSHHVAILHGAARQGIEPEAALAREGFEITQWAGQSAAAAALAQMAARQAKGTGALAQVVRERQDLEGQWRTLDAQLNDAVAKGDVALSAALRSELSGLNARFAAIDARLAREFPDYAALSNPKPLSVAAAQALLGADEALFLTIDVDSSNESFAWLVTKTDARWVKLALSPKDIADKVQALRCGLDHDGEWGAQDRGRAQQCLRLLKLNAAPKETDALPFDLLVAHDLFEGLFGPFKGMIADKQLLIVPSGALASLPFQVLVTENPAAAFPADGSYAGVPWFGARHATSVLPSVTSLKALREHAKVSTATKSYLGLGNPLLTGPSGDNQTASRKQSCPAGSPNLATRVAARAGLRGDAGKPLRGGLADLALLRQQQPLPETADELCEVGRSLAASSSDILLGGKATERTVKSLSASGALAGYRVLHFATHGLLPQETASIAAGLTEAALLLTPPNAASDDDDGLLTASEVTLLKLNADWVIISACNTGGGDKSGEALSGLARAFFYAGARALLVSHWYVDSASAVALTTKIFDEMKRDPKLGRADALRRSMQALIASGGRFSHPANWAPFVVVGEGAAADEDRKKTAVVAPPAAPATPPVPVLPAVVVPPAPPATPPTPIEPAVGIPSTIKVNPLSPERERALKPKDSFMECDACPEMVVAPAGSFTMGSPASEKERESDEGPQRRVTFAQQFAVGRFAVTFDEWDACVADGGCNGYRPEDSGWGRGKRPVINVNWDDAKAYVAWLSRKTGKTYRLLSEAEREYVARVGTTTPFWWGSTISTSQANYDGYWTYAGGRTGEDRQKTVPVDSFQPNPWGLYQVHGNVHEWTEDCWNARYRGAPTDGSAWTAGDCSKRVIRGGSWGAKPSRLRAAARFGNSTVDRDSSDGFRVARTLMSEVKP